MAKKPKAVVLGVGALRGIGGAASRRFAKEGYHVLVAGRTPTKIEAVVDTIRKDGGAATAFTVDGTKEDQVIRLFDAAMADHNDSGPADLFGHDDFEFTKFLIFLERNFERVILLGDVWETLTGRLPDARGELFRARNCHPDLAKRFLSPRYTYVPVPAAPDRAGMAPSVSIGRQVASSRVSSHRSPSGVPAWLPPNTNIRRRPASNAVVASLRETGGVPDGRSADQCPLGSSGPNSST